jgi:DNA-binding winged helix-turn-helix (wHTH) protein
MSLPSPSPASQILRFGVFEADLSSGELRKNGVKIRLQEQPFQILAFLLTRPGELVTRQDLRDKLWSNDTFVDFDHSLNTAINKLREALGDSASSPRFVETVARRGYRFLASVESAQPALDVNGETKPAATTDVPFHPELEVPLPHRAVTRGLFVLIQIMYLSFYLAALFHWSQIDHITDAFLPGWESFTVLVLILVTAGIGIPLRCYLISAASFDYRRLGEKFRQMFLFVLVLDLLWAASPLLITHKIGFGAAFAATAALLYVPFSERTLVRLAYPPAARA